MRSNLWAKLFSIIAIIFIYIISVLVIISFYECNHQWCDADCTSPQICIKCRETQGVALGHTFASSSDVFAQTHVGWSAHRIDKGIAQIERICTRCNKGVDASLITYNLDISSDKVKNGVFTFSPEEFLSNIGAKYTDGIFLIAQEHSTGGTVYSIVPYDHPKISDYTNADEIITLTPFINFLDRNNNLLPSSQIKSKNCAGLVFSFTGENDLPYLYNSLAIEAITTCTTLDELSAFAALCELNYTIDLLGTTSHVGLNNLDLYAVRDEDCFILNIIPKK